MLLKYVLENLQSSTYQRYRGKVTFRILHTLGFAILEEQDYLRGAEALIAWLELEEGHTLSNDTLFWSYSQQREIHMKVQKRFFGLLILQLFIFVTCCYSLDWNADYFHDLELLYQPLSFYLIENQIYPALTPNEHYQESAPSMMIKFIFISFFSDKNTHPQRLKRNSRFGTHRFYVT